MRKILLIDIDSTIPNLALHKIAKFYADKGYQIDWNTPLFSQDAEKIFVSCIFPENKEMCDTWEGRAEIGGTGYDIKKTLPLEIEMVKPRINWGFTTRGCIRKCYFCFVPEKEGNVHIVGDIYDIWDGKSKELMIMDNNILAMPDHFHVIAEQLLKENLKVDFNQGLDHRLLTDELAKKLLSLKHKAEIRFSFDNIKSKKTVINALNILKDNGLKDWGSRWYVYIGKDDTINTVLNRMNFLHNNKQMAYVMRDRGVATRKEYIALAKWGNSISGAFKKPLKELFEKSSGMKPYYKYLKDYI